MKVRADNPNFGGRVPHLLLKKGEISDIVLLPGDPKRVEMFSDLLKGFEILASNREYVVAKGVYQGVPVTVCSTGIGGSSTEIAVIELIEIGAKALIRIGGTGALKEEINCGDMIISTACMRGGGVSDFYAPKEYPAVASFEVVDALIEACRKHHQPYQKGIGSSVGSFFAGQAREALGKSFHPEDLIEKYQNLNILNMEMEAETIMTLGSIFGVLTGAICAVHANRITNEWLYEFEDAQKKMCRIALDAVLILQEVINRKGDSVRELIGAKRNASY